VSESSNLRIRAAARIKRLALALFVWLFFIGCCLPSVTEVNLPLRGVFALGLGWT
jgi:hypothetical protein